MKWYEFRNTEVFKNADIVYTVNKDGEEIEVPSDKLQRMKVVGWRKIGYSNMFPREIEVTVE